MDGSSSPRRLELWDYVSLSILVFLSTLVGLYHVFTGKKSKVAKDFLVSSNELGLLPLILSGVATFFSAIGMLGFPVEIYNNGLNFLLIVVPLFIGAPIGMYFYLPVFFKLNQITIYEYLEVRFCKSIRVCTSLMVTIQTLMYTAIVMYAPALALSQVTGIHLWTCVVSIGVACILYTSMGGIKAVVWADATQIIVMLGVVLTIVIKATIDIGGFGNVYDRLHAGNRTQIFYWSPNPNSRYTAWTLLVANPVHILSIFTLNQSLMQRYLCNKTLKKAQISYFGGVLGVGIGNCIYILEGMLLYAYYHSCDPLLAGEIDNRDQLMALFAVEVLSFCKGFPGIFVAAIMCATLSTLSSMLNSLTAVTLSDYVKAFKPNLSNQASMKLSRILVVVYGVACMALVALAENMGGIIQATFGIGGLIGGPILTIFTLGLLLPWINSTGAICGLIASVIFPLWAWVGSMIEDISYAHSPYHTYGCTNFTAVIEATSPVIIERTLLQQFYSIPSFWYTSWSLIVGTVVALLVTKFITSQDILQIDPDLLFSFMRNYVLRKKKELKQIGEETAEDKLQQQVIQPLLTMKLDDKIELNGN